MAYSLLFVKYKCGPYFSVKHGVAWGMNKWLFWGNMTKFTAQHSFSCICPGLGSVSSRILKDHLIETALLAPQSQGWHLTTRPLSHLSSSTVTVVIVESESRRAPRQPPVTQTTSKTSSTFQVQWTTPLLTIPVKSGSVFYLSFQCEMSCFKPRH